MITFTDEEWQALQQHLAELTTQVADLRAHLAAAQKRIAELETQKRPPPSFVKANRPEKPSRERQKRAPEQNHARRRETPTQIVAHRIERCPDCQGRLSGLHVGRRRQVIDLPPPPPVEISEHQVYRGWCSFCGKWRAAPLDLRGQVAGQGRLGVRLAALITRLRQGGMRGPIRLIQQWLRSVHGLTVSVGGVTDLLAGPPLSLLPASV